MSQTILIIIFIIIGICAITSIVIGLLNWISLSSTSTLINQLQTEIEKKYSELETAKKEKQGVPEITPSIHPSVNQEPFIQSQQTQPQDNEQQIEIVRNVRGDFASTEPSSLRHETLDMHPPEQEPPDYLQPLPSFQQTHFSYPPAEQPDTGAPRHDMHAPVEPLAKITLNQHPTAYRNNYITIPLYSQANQDTDFDLLYKSIAPICEAGEQAFVAIDLKNILFLYEQEIAYLRNVHSAVASCRGQISFVNCSPELISILKKDPVLGALEMKEE